MQDLDMEFFREYKRLDNLLGDMLGSPKGVSTYIEEMERTCGGAIPSWGDDYRTLKHLRWVRNQIAHNPGDQFSTGDDLCQLQDFYRRAMRGDDPFSRLTARRRAQEAARTQQHRQQYEQRTACPPPRQDSFPPVPKRPNIWPGLLLALLMLAGATILVYGLTG